MKFAMLMFLAIGMLATSFIANAALSYKDKTCLLFLPCDEITDKMVLDLSPNKNDGEVVGTVNLVEGKFGKALEFKESGEVKCPYIPLNNKSFTVCMWVNPKLAGGSEQCVFTQIQANATNTSLHFRIYTSATIRMGFYSNDLDAAGAVKANEWVHICFWLDVPGKSRRIYINGSKVAEDQGKSGIEYLGKSGNTMIGSWSTSGQKFNGLIDEVQVWDKALSETEVKESMGNLKTSAKYVEPSGKLASTWGDMKF